MNFQNSSKKQDFDDFSGILSNFIIFNEWSRFRYLICFLFSISFLSYSIFSLYLFEISEFQFIRCRWLPLIVRLSTQLAEEPPVERVTSRSCRISIRQKTCRRTRRWSTVSPDRRLPMIWKRRFGKKASESSETLEFRISVANWRRRRETLPAKSVPVNPPHPIITSAREWIKSPLSPRLL